MPNVLKAYNGSC